jgi:uncharacterized membrane protein YczE
VSIALNARLFKRLAMTLTGVLVCSFSVGMFNTDTFSNMFFTGYIVEGSYQFLAGLFPHLDLLSRALVLGAAVVIMCFGSALYYTADLGVSVYDAISLKLAALKPKVGHRVVPFKWIRVISDCLCVVVGTLITALFMGPLIAFFNRVVAEPFLNGKGSHRA